MHVVYRTVCRPGQKAAPHASGPKRFHPRASDHGQLTNGAAALGDVRLILSFDQNLLLGEPDGT